MWSIVVGALISTPAAFLTLARARAWTGGFLMFRHKVKSAAPENETKKLVWQMGPAERLAECMERILALHEFFTNKGANVQLHGTSLVVGTPNNNYCIDIADDEPRMIKMQVIYEIVPGDIDRASWACYNAQAQVFAAKTKAIPHGDGYRLYIAVEAMFGNIKAFTDVADIYMACIEDCREGFLSLVAQAADMEEVSWSTQPKT